MRFLVAVAVSPAAELTWYILCWCVFCCGRCVWAEDFWLIADTRSSSRDAQPHHLMWDIISASFLLSKPPDIFNVYARESKIVMLEASRVDCSIWIRCVVLAPGFDARNFVQFFINWTAVQAADWPWWLAFPSIILVLVLRFIEPARWHKPD